MSGVALDVSRWVIGALHVTGWSLLYSLVVGGGLGLALAGVLTAMHRRSAWARYALCCGAMVLMLGVALQSWVSIQSAYSGHEGLVDSYAAQLMHEGAPRPDGPLAGGWNARDLARAVEARHDRDLAPWIGGAAAASLGSLLAFAAAVWIVFASIRLFGLVCAVRSLHRLSRRAVSPVAPRWQRLLEALRKRLDVWHPVTLVVSEHVDAPILIGWWRPTILIPSGPHDYLSDAEAEAILAHELAHIRRGDYAINLLQSVTEALLFFNPAVGWLGDRIRDEREFCSDDLAHRSIRGSIADYLRALVTLEDLRAGVAPEPAVAANGRSLLRRIQRLADVDRMPNRPRLDVDALLVVVLLVALWIPTLHAARSVEHATVTVMKHELRLPRDYERLARSAVSGEHASGRVDDE